MDKTDPAPVAVDRGVMAPTRWMRHVKTGGLYEVMGPAKLEATGQELTIYRALKDGEVWARPTAEFNDGRFVLATPSDQPEPTYGNDII